MAQVAIGEDSPKRGQTIGRVILLLLLLYIFLVSISLMGTAFKSLGKGAAKEMLATTSNPFVGLLIGILATSLVQSSSTTTSILVGMVGGDVISIQNASPIVMGANIGTSVTNTIVSVAHISRSDEFKRAFASSTVHDFFNIIAVVILFPLHLRTNILGWASGELAGAFDKAGGLKFTSPLRLIVQPAVGFIEKVMTYAAGKITLFKIDLAELLMIIASLALLFMALRYIVITLKSLVLSRIEVFFDRYIFRTALRAMLFGMILTVMVQSSSITTSIAVPLAGAGILTLEQIFPYTLGANIGTTVTAILASLATGNISAVTVAFAHLLFNVFGIVIIWPIRKVPISLARALANFSLKSKAMPLVYILLAFFAIPITLIYFVR